MRDAARHAGSVGAAIVAAVLLVTALGLLTNSIDTQRFSWDFRYYIALAEHGFSGTVASPFAYRYLTPILARGISEVLRISIESGFAALAWFGAITQLVAVFLFSRWYAKSTRGAWFAMLVTALSLFSVKFLLFDTFRPDHLALPLILLQAYFALTGRFSPLLVSTIIGCQIREFNALPLVAYVFASLRKSGTTGGAERGKVIRETAISLIALAAALVLPRLLISVSEDFQFAGFSRDGILRALLAPFILRRDANFIFSTTGYLLPVLMLASPREIIRTIAALLPRDRRFLIAYTALVLALSFLGGTDFFRFAPYLIVPQAILLGILGDGRRAPHLAIVLAATFVFNRIWLPFPMADRNAYLDFYGGYGDRFNLASVLRIMELAALVAVGRASSWLLSTRESSARAME